MDDLDKCCKTCKYHENGTCVCICWRSEYFQKYMGAKEKCGEWAPKRR